MSSPDLPARMVNIYREALMGFSCSTDSLSNALLFQDCVISNAGIVDGMYIPEIWKR